ncbi:MAG: 2'-5' RNA ligase family protein [Gemmatimonadaceae bacterium]
MTRTIRRQLSLFAPDAARGLLDALRAVLDPVQHRLIPAHVTLCREDELGALGATAISTALALRTPAALTLVFGPAESFDGHGIRLPCIEGEEHFHQLRAQILAHAFPEHTLRRPAAHLTLAHPRNPRATGNTLAEARRVPSRLPLAFPAVQLIEQVDAAPWTVVASFPLETHGGSDA